MQTMPTLTPSPSPFDCQLPIEDTPLLHTVTTGHTAHFFVRDGLTSAHLVITGGYKPRLLAAFAAGNSGAALWFSECAQAIEWKPVENPKTIHELDAAGRSLHGIETVIDVLTEDARLVIRSALIGSVRVLRDHEFDGRLPAFGMVAPSVQKEALGDIAQWARNRLDGEAGYVLTLQVEGGCIEVAEDGVTSLVGPRFRPLRLRLRALTGERALMPMSANELLTPLARDLPSARRSLELLAYQEKLLAGSWRFLTYFGRDTLMSLRLLLPVLRPTAVEVILASIFDRLSRAGEVAHEEDIGEFPILTRMVSGQTLSTNRGIAEPIFDYKMVDDDFMLMPVVVAYLLNTSAGSERAAAFLARNGDDGISFGVKLLLNIGCVLRKAQPFFIDQKVTSLVRLKPGETVGDWRDSADGLGGGVYSYSVNAVLVPAALDSIESMLASDLLLPFLSTQVVPSTEQVGAMSRVWTQHASTFFSVAIPNGLVNVAIARYADEVNVPMSPALNHVGTSPLEFSALALDDAGQPIPVMHSDFGFALLLTNPSSEVLDRELATLTRPFPAGLFTDAGLVVANAAFADRPIRDLFAADRYHGAVIWSWQQAMVAAGLERQIARSDLPDSTRSALVEAQVQLWRAINNAHEMADSELWTWEHLGGAFTPVPYGPKSKTADESNAAQLWSTVYLAINAPHESGSDAVSPNVP